jgi:pyruvate/2-oxoglutarate/acetoin dehydrogenase E1 component
MQMREITYREALREALREEMRRDKAVFLLGEDIGRYWGGAFKVTEGLAEEFGDERVRDAPISESAIIGTAVGAAITGMRPVAEIMFGDLTTLAMDQIANQAAKICYMFGGQTSVPLVMRTPFGAGVNIASHHSQSLEAWFMHVPGLQVAVPSTPYDAKGLLKTAVRSDNPVVFFEDHMVLPQ